MQKFQIRGETYDWVGGGSGGTPHPPTMKAVYPHMLARKCDPQGRKPLKRSEENYVQKLRLIPRDRRLPELTAGPYQIGIWLGLTPYQVEKALAPFPCQGMVEPIYGHPEHSFKPGGPLEGKHIPPDHVYRMCQEARLCHQCGQAASLLGTAWCVPSSAEVVYKTLISYIINDTLGSRQELYPYKPSSEVHVCTDTCMHTITLAEATKRWGNADAPPPEKRRRQ